MAFKKELTPISAGRKFTDNGDISSIAHLLTFGEKYEVEIYGGDKLTERNDEATGEAGRIPKQRIGYFVGVFHEFYHDNRAYPTFIVDKANDVEDEEAAWFKVEGERVIYTGNHQKVHWLYWFNDKPIPYDPLLATELAEKYLYYGLCDQFIEEKYRRPDELRTMAMLVQRGWRPWTDSDKKWEEIQYEIWRETKHGVDISKHPASHPTRT